MLLDAWVSLFLSRDPTFKRERGGAKKTYITDGLFLFVCFSRGYTFARGTIGLRSLYVILSSMTFWLMCYSFPFLTQRALGFALAVSDCSSSRTLSPTKTIRRWAEEREMGSWLPVQHFTASVRFFFFLLSSQLEMQLIYSFLVPANATEEFFVRKRPLYEVVGQLGMWGFIINGIQSSALEWKGMRDAPWNAGISESFFPEYT